MRILAVSDVESKFIWEYFDPAMFRGVDLMISCGDLDAKYLSYLVTMIPVPLFYVPGNHDKSYLYSPPEGCECIDGRIVNYKGLRLMGLGGCKSPRPNTFEYSERQMSTRVKKMSRIIKKSDGFDVLVTHAPAFGLGDSEGTYHEGFETFRSLVDTYKPALHLFGHKHLSCSPVKKDAAFRYGETDMINVSGYRFIDIDVNSKEAVSL